MEAFRGAGGRNLVLLHCVSLYPTPASELNLRRMTSLRHAFGCPVGFSDHSEGVVVAAIAAAMGAAVIEKHFTLDRSLPGPDHSMSSDPAELAALVRAVRDAEASLGRPELLPAIGEADARLKHRLSCVAATALLPGHRVGRDDIAFRQWPAARQCLGTARPHVARCGATRPRVLLVRFPVITTGRAGPRFLVEMRPAETADARRLLSLRNFARLDSIAEPAPAGP